MSERAFGQSRDIPIAEYSYRHEAEFAAGFLSDAGIPFRLQVDDAGGADAGVTIARPAVLWVRKEDVEQARELLEIGIHRPEPTRSAARNERAVAGDRLIPRLTGLERGVALGTAVLFFVLAVWAGDSGMLPLAFLSLALAALLGGSAILGVTIAPIKSALRALSGDAP